jgi:membrane-bound lytic murein transglycosylase A
MIVGRKKISDESTVYCAKTMSRIYVNFLSALTSALLFGCSSQLPIKKVTPPEGIRPFEHSTSLSQAVSATIKKLVSQKVDYSKPLKSGTNSEISRCFSSRWERIWTLQRVRALLQTSGGFEALPWSVLDDFQVYAPSNRGRPERTLVTGYYEPVLKGSHTPNDRFRYPLYSMPASEDLRTLTRRSIDYENGLAGRGYELVWLESDVERFFLQIQGSGVIELPNGELLRVGYAGKNSQPYVPVGRVLVERGLLELAGVTMDSIKSVLNTLPSGGKPGGLEEVLSQNGSYVYFEVRKQSATGSLGVELTPWGSFASDPGAVPLGSIGLVELGDGRFGLMISQDTGGAIKGTQHIDVFTGRGEEAGFAAGQMKDKREVYYLARKECAKDDL